MQSLHENLKQLTSQKSENESVKTEFAELEPEGSIWKLTGPILIKQDREDAFGNVAKRLEFITSELSRAEDAIKKAEILFEEKRQDLIKIQSEIQAVTV